MTLPKSAALLTELLNNFPKLKSNPSESPSNSIDLAFSEAKTNLLTLHVIYPTVLLPALDLLDRRAITRLVLRVSDHENRSTHTSIERVRGHCASVDSIPSILDAGQKASHQEGSFENAERVVYLADSSNNREHSGRGRLSKRAELESSVYEVRLKAWSCSCAAFVFAGLDMQGSCDESEPYRLKTFDIYSEMDTTGRDSALKDPKTSEDPIERLQWGGLFLDKDGSQLPICKHILACFIGEHWHFANGTVKRRVVEQDEMAGWAAGWGG